MTRLYLAWGGLWSLVAIAALARYWWMERQTRQAADERFRERLRKWAGFTTWREGLLRSEDMV